MWETAPPRMPIAKPEIGGVGAKGADNDPTCHEVAGAGCLDTISAAGWRTGYL